MKFCARQRIWLAIVIVVNAVIWAIPSNVVTLIARDRQTLLGRYSRSHFTVCLIVALISIVSLYVDWSTGKKYKRRWFQVILTLLVLAPSVVVLDFVARSPASTHYIRDKLAYHRPPNEVFHATVVDKPNAYRSYPNAPKGYPSFEGTLTTDERGYRNPAPIDRCDVLAIGDSFTEGSNVSDDDPWPVRLATLTGLVVYNGGMSGYDPLHYRAALDELGPSLHPRVVVMMLFEGNDFRSAKSDAKRTNERFSARFHRYVKQSPVINALNNIMVHTFGPINSTGPVAGVDILDWLPLHIPDNDAGHFYAFPPKQLRDAYESRDAFAQDRHWLNSREHLMAMNNRCREIGATFVVTYAPVIATVALPLVADRLNPEHVRAFLKLRYKRTLPPAETFIKELLSDVDARHDVVRDWCRRESIPFVDLTEVLRDATRSGTQTYFTYDQHWTPRGHAVVARTIADFLKTNGLPEPVDTPDPTDQASLP